jgi:hypothetical protein
MHGIGDDAAWTNWSKRGRHGDDTGTMPRSEKTLGNQRLGTTGTMGSMLLVKKKWIEGFF